MSLQKQMQANISRLYVFSFFSMFLIVIPVIVPFFLDLGLSMQEVFIAQSVFAFVVTVLEVPSGYLCDMWGRKWTLVLGGAFYGCGFTFMYFARDLTGVLFYEVVLGVAMALISGADISLLYDSILASGDTDVSRPARGIGNVLFYKLTGETVASLMGGVLVLWSFRHVVGAQWVVAWLPFLVALTLTEPPFQKMAGKGHWANMKVILGDLFRGSRVLRLILLNLVAYGLATYLMVWMFQKYWQEAGVPLAHFGYLWAGYNFVVAIVSKFTPRLQNRWGLIPVLVIIGLLPVVGYFGMAVFFGWFGVALGLTFQVGRGLTQVTLRDALNSRIPSSYRATANSMVSLGVRLVFCLVGPAIGFSLDRWGVTAPVHALGWIFLGVFVFLLIPLIREFRRGEVSGLSGSAA